MTSSAVPWTRVLGERTLYVLLALCALCTALAYQSMPAQHVDLTSSLQAVFLEGFYPPEQSPTGPFRWTGPRADVRLPGLFGRQSVRVSLVLSAPRPAGAVRTDNPGQPVALQVLVNGQQQTTLDVGPSPQQFTLDVDPQVMGLSGNLYLTLRSPAFSLPNDLRQLGVTVYDISASPLSGGPFLPAGGALLSLMLVVGLAYVWLRRLGLPSTLAACLVVACMVMSTLGLLVARPFVIPASHELLLILAVACIASEVTVSLAGDASLTARRATAILFLVAIAIRVVLAHSPGDADNFTAFKIMIDNVTTHGIAAAYDIDPVVGAYPPLHHYDLALVGQLYRAFVSPDFYVASRQLNFVMKMPAIVLDMLITMLVMVYGWRQRGSRLALLAGLAFALNPATIYTTAYNGQLGDPLYAFLIALAVAALLARQGALTGVATALAVLTKPQAAAFLPFLLLASWRHLTRRQLMQGIVGGVIAAALVLAPFVLADTVGNMIHTVSTTIGHGPRIASNALNIWWLWGWGQAWDIKDTEALFGPITYRVAGLVLFFLLAYGLIAWRTWSARTKGELALAAAFTGLAFFMLPTEIHENYLFPTIALLCLAAAHERRAWPLLAVLSATWFIDMVSYDQTIMQPLLAAWPRLAGAVFPLQETAALINVGVLILWAWWMVPRAGTARAREAPAA